MHLLKIRLSCSSRRTIVGVIYIGACIDLAIRMLPITASWAARLVGSIASLVAVQANSSPWDFIALFLSLGLGIVGAGLYLSPVIISCFAIKGVLRWMVGGSRA